MSQSPDTRSTDQPQSSVYSYLREYRYAVLVLLAGIPTVHGYSHYKMHRIDNHLARIQREARQDKARADEQERIYGERRLSAPSALRKQEIIIRVRALQEAALQRVCDTFPVEAFLNVDSVAMLDNIRQQIIEVQSKASEMAPYRAALAVRSDFAPDATYISYGMLADWLLAYWADRLSAEPISARQMVGLASNYRFLVPLLEYVPGAGEMYIHQLIRDGQRNGTVNERLRMLWASAASLPALAAGDRHMLTQDYIQACAQRLPAAERALFQRVLATYVPGQEQIGLSQ